MGTTLVLALIENNFFPVFGTTECSISSMQHIAAGKDPELVGKRDPLHWDYNNGTTVVYDDEGKPWIRSSKYITPEWTRDFARRHHLQKGAFVPHSNDGGTYKRLIAEQTGEII